MTDFHSGNWEPFFPKWFPRQSEDGTWFWRIHIFRRPWWDDYLEEGPIYEYAEEPYGTQTQ